MQAAGGRQPVLEGRPAKAVYAAFSNQGGMLSVLLVREGLMGDCAVFEGEAGYFKTYYGGRYVREALVDGLGRQFHLLNVGFKPWPTTGLAHPYIEAALALRQRHGLTAANVASVHILGHAHVRTFCEPPETRRRPSTPVEAEDSVPFAVGKALATGHVGLADLQPEGLGHPETLAIVDRITYAIDESVGKVGVVQVTTTDGRTLEERVERPLGHPSKPLTRELALEKLFDCARYAARPIPEAQLREGIDLIDHLEDLPDVRALPAIFSGLA
jgi:2-methylcitrate dehydratase PrpD